MCAFRRIGHTQKSARTRRPSPPQNPFPSSIKHLIRGMNPLRAHFLGFFALPHLVIFTRPLMMGVVPLESFSLGCCHPFALALVSLVSVRTVGSGVRMAGGRICPSNREGRAPLTRSKGSKAERPGVQYPRYFPSTWWSRSANALQFYKYQGSKSMYESKGSEETMLLRLQNSGFSGCYRMQ